MEESSAEELSYPSKGSNHPSCNLPVSAMWAMGNRENFTKRMYVDLSSSGARPWGNVDERRVGEIVGLV